MSGRRLAITHLDHTRERGGAEYALKRVLEADSRSWNATVVLPADGVGLDLGVYATLPANNVDVEIVGHAMSAGASSAGIAGVLGYAAGLVREAWTLRSSPHIKSADLVHANSTRSAVYAALALVGRRTPLVIHLRDMVTSEALGRAGHLLMSRVVLKRADGVIANSAATLASVQSYLKGATATAVIASPIGEITASKMEATGDRALRIGMVARIDPWKGQKELIEAFASGAPDDAVLVLAGAAAFGHAEYLDELHQSARRLGVSDRVEFSGHVEDVNALLSTLDICVHASIRPEPLGQNMLQYLAAGRATIAVDAGGPAEWITDGVNGMLTPIQDTDALARAIHRMAVDDGLREQLAQAAAQTPGLPTDSASAVAHAEFFYSVARQKVSR